MDAFTIIIVVIVALFFLFKSDFGKDPTKKTDKMLWRELDLHWKRVEADSGFNGNKKRLEKSISDKARVETELKRRGLL